MGFVFINRVTETSITYRLMQVIIRVVFSNLDLNNNQEEPYLKFKFMIIITPILKTAHFYEKMNSDPND